MEQQKKELKRKELKRAAAITESLYFQLDELMSLMETRNDNGQFEIATDDEKAYHAIGDLHDYVDAKRMVLADICGKY